MSEITKVISKISKLSPTKGDVLVLEMGEDVGQQAREELAAMLVPIGQQFGCFILLLTKDLDMKLLTAQQKHHLVTELTKPVE